MGGGGGGGGCSAVEVGHLGVEPLQALEGRLSAPLLL
jgi:hypothetical protein